MVSLMAGNTSQIAVKRLTRCNIMGSEIHSGRKVRFENIAIGWFMPYSLFLPHFGVMRVFEYTVIRIQTSCKMESICYFRPGIGYFHNSVTVIAMVMALGVQIVRPNLSTIRSYDFTLRGNYVSRNCDDP